jgi:2-hydroxychromene-2-carboxylate isomerase
MRIVTELAFYFDLGSPFAYLAAERLPALLPATVRWEPVLVGGLFKLTGRSSWARGDEQRRRDGMEDVQRRASTYGLPAVRWPDPWPGDYLFVMRAATAARAVGRGTEFAMAAFRSAFQAGTDLSLPAQVLRTAAAAGLDPDHLRQATQEPQIKRALRDATERAYERGVFGVPTVAVGDELFWGDDRLQDAAARAFELGGLSGQGAGDGPGAGPHPMPEPG